MRWRYTYTGWKMSGERSKYFDSFKVYIVEMYDPKTEEYFYKIGKTFRTVDERFTVLGFPYKVGILAIYEGDDGIAISKLEHELQKLNKKNKYLPKKTFDGMSECFNNLEEDTFNK
jgi:hypothetical protein